MRIGRLAAPVSHCVYIRYETLLRHSLHGELEHRLVVCTAGVDLRGPYLAAMEYVPALAGTTLKCSAYRFSTTLPRSRR